MAATLRPEDFDYREFPNRLNLGCGWDVRDGYLNVDFIEEHKPNLLADVLDLPMLPDGHYVEIVAQDVLEHVKRTDVDAALREWRRLMAPGGEIILRVPDVIGAARVLASTTDLDKHVALIQCLYGTQAYTGDYHHVGFTELTLKAALHEAGFVVTDLQRRDEWLFDCVATTREPDAAFDPGPMPFLQLVDQPVVVEAPVSAAASTAGPSGVDRIVSAVGARTPEGARALVQKVWRPLRRLAVKAGVIR